MKIFIFSLLFITNIINASELSWVDEQVEAIKPPRPGIDSQLISSIKNPFIFLEKNGAKKIKITKKKVIKTVKKTVSKPSKKTVAKLTLEIVINSSALINGKWYKTGDHVKGYTIKKVKKRSVIVTYNGKKSTLYITHKKSNLNFKKK